MLSRFLPTFPGIFRKESGETGKFSRDFSGDISLFPMISMRYDFSGSGGKNEDYFKKF